MTCLHKGVSKGMARCKRPWNIINQNDVFPYKISLIRFSMLILYSVIQMQHPHNTLIHKSAMTGGIGPPNSDSRGDTLKLWDKSEGYLQSKHPPVDTREPRPSFHFSELQKALVRADISQFLLLPPPW